MEINLEQFINGGKTISGREHGIKCSNDVGLLSYVDNNEKVEIVIDPTKIEAINDSFIKGFFNPVFQKYKSKSLVKNFITIKSDGYFIGLIDKNFTILEAMSN
jgi:hypothetical protein